MSEQFKNRSLNLRRSPIKLKTLNNPSGPVSKSKPLMVNSELDNRNEPPSMYGYGKPGLSDRNHRLRIQSSERTHPNTLTAMPSEDTPSFSRHQDSLRPQSLLRTINPDNSNM